MKKKYKYFLVLVVLPGLLSGCMGTRYLKKDEKLLYHQSISAPKGFTTDVLKDLYVQKENRKLFGLPINSLVWMYYTGARRYHPEKFVAKRDRIEKKFDTKIEAASSEKRKNNLKYRKQKKVDGLNVKIESGNMFMQWGEKVSVYDSAAVQGTVERFDSYLFSKGYFKGKSSSETIENKRRVNVKYHIHPGPRYFYDSIAYDIADSIVGKTIFQHMPETLVKRGDPFDQDKLNTERERIDLLLKDHGYFDFSRQYIDFDIDTAFKSGYRVALRVEVKNPAQRDFHKQFRIDSISFTPDASTTPVGNAKRTTHVYRNIAFNYYTNLYSKKILSQRVFILKDSLYSRTATLETQQKLTNLDVFKFANVNYDTSGGKFIANIFTSPLDRYSWSNEAGFTVTQGFPGPYFSTTLRKRNIFRGLENFDINGRFGFEGVASPTHAGNFYKSTEAGLNATLTFPQFLIPLSPNTGYRYGKFNPKTKLLVGYVYTDRPPDYTRAINTVSATYTWETNKRKLQYSLTPINLNVIRSTVSQEFDSLLNALKTNQGNNLINSFKPSYVSSIIFSVMWNPNNYGNTLKSALFMRGQIESGGTLYNFLTPTYAINRGLETYKYIRLTFEVKKTVVIDKNNVVAYHFNSGMAYSYGANRSLPYEKYFFAGGSNGVRAWRPRRLGIGSQPVKLSSDPAKNGLFDYSYEKPGEILLEGSVELRKRLFGFLSGAVFIDVGNVWTFTDIPPPQDQPDYPTWTGNTKFKLDTFYKEFGIGTGFGLRFDFTFLVLRLDVGIKAYDPARQEGDRFILTKAKFWSPYNTSDPNVYRDPVIYNVGIGYPF